MTHDRRIGVRPCRGGGVSVGALMLAVALAGCNAETDVPQRSEAASPKPAMATAPTPPAETTADPPPNEPSPVVTEKGNPLTDPALANETSPDQFTVRLETTKGPIDILVTRDDAPLGADRFYNLVKIGFFTDIGMFRVVPGFVVQFGIHGDPTVSTAWQNAKIRDDPVRTSNKRGTLTFATSGKHSRTTQLFINYGDNSGLDGMGFSPFGEFISGMSTIDEFF